MDIINTGTLLASPCNVYKKEKLCYLFVGRPSYKKSGKGEVPYWMLPAVFILKGLDHLPVKRIHPLDTGAFKAGRLPDYLTTFELESFALGTDPAQISRVISAFYDTTERYMRGDSRSLENIKSQVQIDARHARIEALIKLYSERSLKEIDDRGRNIEIQIGDDVPLTNNLLGVVMPEEYGRVEGLDQHFRSMGAITEYYPLYPLNSESHLGLVYSAVAKIFASSNVR